MDENSFDRAIMTVFIAAVVILALLFGGDKQAPAYSTDSHNISIETHSTNVDICGICINTDR